MTLNRLFVTGSAAAVALVISSSPAGAGEEREYRVYRDGQYEVRVEREYDPRFERRYETRIERRYEPGVETRIERRYEPGVITDIKPPPAVETRVERPVIERRHVTRVERQPRLYGHPTAAVYRDTSRARGSVRSLSADAFRRVDGWDLRAEYKARIRDAAPPQRFELVLHPLDRDRLMLDEQGRALSVAIPLERPSDIGRNRADFEHRASIFIPHEAVWSRSIEVRADLVDRDTGAVLDSRTRSVRFRD